MIKRSTFEYIKEKYGYYASWAIWADEGEKPKDNVGDLSIFDIDANPGLLQQLNPDIILVALNISRGDIRYPLANFHDARPEAMDFKIRYALRGSPLWGAYMTDIIKDFDEKISGKLMSHLQRNRTLEIKNVEFFRQEISDLGVDNPTLVAFGNAVYTILARNFGGEYTIIKLPHYSNWGSKEAYRDTVKAIVEGDTNLQYR